MKVRISSVIFFLVMCITLTMTIVIKAYAEPSKEGVIYRGVLTEEQRQLMSVAFEEGVQFTFPETVQAILLQETSAGINGPVGDLDKSVGKRSYCHMQLEVGTARDMIVRLKLGEFKTDEELIAKLLTDDRFCIMIGARYFEWLLNYFNGDYRMAVLAYNRGPGGAQDGKDPMDYVSGVLEHIKTHVRPFNAAYGNVVPKPKYVR